jgi:type IV pilus assembly protein PilM
MEIHKTFDYFGTTIRSRDIDEVYLSGGASRTEGLREYLQDRLRVQVQFLNPFKQILTQGRQFSSSLLNELAPDFAVAVGLALADKMRQLLFQLKLIQSKQQKL